MSPPKPRVPTRGSNQVYVRTLFDLPREVGLADQDEHPYKTWMDDNKYQHGCLFLVATMPETFQTVYVYTTCVMHCKKGYPFAALVHGDLTLTAFDRNQHTSNEVLNAINDAQEIRHWYDHYETSCNNKDWIEGQMVRTKSGIDDTVFPVSVYFRIMRWRTDYNIVSLNKDATIILDTGQVNYR